MTEADTARERNLAFPPPPLQPDPRYPESDGTPMGESDFHITALLHLRQALRHVFRHDEKLYVAANMLLYFEEGDPTAVKAPDVFVVRGVSRHDRRTYRLWEEKVAPCVVFEITSRSTRLEDQGAKRAVYEMLAVKEYFLFDPLGEYLSSPLQGFQLEGTLYRPLAPSADGSLRSRELDLLLRPQGTLLRIVDPATGELVPTLEEATERAARAEAELAHLRAEVADLRRHAGESSA